MVGNPTHISGRMQRPLFLAHRFGEDGGKPMPVRAFPVALQTIPEIISATGELSAEDTAIISAKVAGRVEKLHVDLGSVVEQGQVLAELEKDDYTFRVKQSEALVEQTRARLGLSKDSDDRVDPLETSAVKQAAASLKEAQLIFNNSSELFKQGVVSNVDYQRAGVALQAAEARRQGAVESIYQAQAELLERRASLSLARQQLVDTTIRAPFHGAIIRRQATPGEYLAGQRARGHAGAPESAAPAPPDSRTARREGASRPADRRACRGLRPCSAPAKWCA